MSNDEDLEKMERKRTLNVRKRQLKFLGQLLRKEGLENLTLTRQGQEGQKEASHDLPNVLV